MPHPKNTIDRITKLTPKLKAYGIRRTTKAPCGKSMGHALYMHHSAARPYLSRAVRSYLDILLAGKPKPYGIVVKLDTQETPYKLLSLTEVPNWDDSPEPQLNAVHRLTGSRWEVKLPTEDPLVYHHKWLFVPDDYTGFNVADSMQRSLTWKTLAGGINKGLSSRIGRTHFWHGWLRQQNLPI